MFFKKKRNNLLIGCFCKIFLTHFVCRIFKVDDSCSGKTWYMTLALRLLDTKKNTSAGK